MNIYLCTCTNDTCIPFPWYLCRHVLEMEVEKHATDHNYGEEQHIFHVLVASVASVASVSPHPTLGIAVW